MSAGAALRNQELAPWLEQTRAWADAALERQLASAGAASPRLGEAVRYAVLGPGKRLRPAIVRLSCSWYGGRDEDALAPALAVELVHAYSLVHDDLPCMDDDVLRRGRATCHVEFGETMAVLVGDALQSMAFELLGAGGSPRAAEQVRVLALAAGAAGMVGGQVLDVEAAGEVQLEEVCSIHRLKTAALFGAAAELGANAAGASPQDCAAAADWGLALGLAFQATDDLLDVTGDAGTLGKTPGKDAAADKPTLVAALGVEGARAEAARLAELAEAAAQALGARSGELPLELVRFVLGREA